MVMALKVVVRTKTISARSPPTLAGIDRSWREFVQAGPSSAKFGSNSAKVATLWPRGGQ